MQESFNYLTKQCADKIENDENDVEPPNIQIGDGKATKSKYHSCVSSFLVTAAPLSRSLYLNPTLELC